MKKELLYKDFAKYYDLIYSYKNYKKESEILTKIILEKKKSDGNLLLDLACGTGSHIFHLKNIFECEGLDKNFKMLRIAAEKNPKIKFHYKSMLEMPYKEYDIIISMFSSIAYLIGLNNLSNVIENIAQSLKVGGIIIIQPWFEPDKFTPGLPFANVIQKDKVHIARLSNSRIENNCSILDIHFLITEAGQKITHYIDQHKMSLFKNSEIMNLLNERNIKTEFFPPNKKNQRGLIVGIKQPKKKGGLV